MDGHHRHPAGRGCAAVFLRQEQHRPQRPEKAGDPPHGGGQGLQPQPLAAAQELAEADSGAASLARYLHGKGGGFSVYRNTEVTYFPGGEAKFEELLRQLEKAEKYIFLEYFIIDEGLMWGRILEVLARKAAEGVDVRVMYDGTCEFTTLPHYPAASKAGHPVPGVLAGAALCLDPL